MKPFKIPYGINTKAELVSAKDAIKKENYFCPKCNLKLILRKGESRRHHFAHKTENILDEKCDYYTATHKIAILIIINRIKSFLNHQGELPKIKRKCLNPACNEEIIYEISDDIIDVFEEYKIDRLSLDVCLKFKKDLFGIEVFHTHKVDDIKVEKLNIPWIEVNAEDVLKNSDLFLCIRDRIDTAEFICSTCRSTLTIYEIDHLLKREEQKIQNREKLHEIKKLASEHNFHLPSSPPYEYDMIVCKSCKNKIVILKWEGSYRQDPPPEPIHDSIRSHDSKILNKLKYYVNICYLCGNEIRE